MAGRHLRPGGTVPGPAQFALADTVGWLITLAHLEPGREAVTAAITMQFLHRPQPADLLGEGRLLKLGRPAMQHRDTRRRDLSTRSLGWGDAP
ncbi:MAG TPA: PaaI family thioesterase, partial [Acidimicrobiales bacterium]|nr:PaaI family thioesterase [Acidimicrobiales bacterium]